MEVVNTDVIQGADITETIGEMRGNSVKAKFASKDIMAGLKGFFGGGISEYADLMEAARDETINNLIKDARQMGADAVINLRFTSSQIGAQNAEILAYGTGVKLAN